MWLITYETSHYRLNWSIIENSTSGYMNYESTRSPRFAATATTVDGDGSCWEQPKPRPYSTTTLGNQVYAVEVERTSASASFDLGLTEHSNFSGLLNDKVLFK